MGETSRYLSQKRRIELYEKQMRNYENFAKETSKWIEQGDDSFEKLDDRLELLERNQTSLGKIARLLVDSRYGPTWKIRRAARRQLKAISKQVQHGKQPIPPPDSGA